MNISKLSIPLEVVTAGAGLILLEVAPYYSYVDGKRTDTMLGYRYLVVEDKTFEKMSVKIPSSEPAITPETLETAKKRIMVAFNGAFARPYRTQNGDYDLSITATGIQIL